MCLGEQENTNVRTAISSTFVHYVVDMFFHAERKSLRWQMRAGILQRQPQQAHLYRWLRL